MCIKYFQIVAVFVIIINFIIIKPWTHLSNSGSNLAVFRTNEDLVKTSWLDYINFFFFFLELQGTIYSNPQNYS